MSTSEEKLADAVAAGDPHRALAAAEAAVRSDPGSARNRTALFQLMCVLGQWSRALNQLETAGRLDAETLAMVSTYREAIKCEMVRAKVFAGQTTPLAFGEPQAWLAWLVEALQRDAAGDVAAARELRERAFDEAEFPTVFIDGKPHEGFADSDPRLGPIVEGIINGRYYWIPMLALARIDIEPPEDLRDFVWAPAHFQFVNGGETVGLIPTRYPGSESTEDGALQLARRTEWVAVPGGMTNGIGQRVFAAGDREFALLELRRIDFHVAPAAS